MVAIRNIHNYIFPDLEHKDRDLEHIKPLFERKLFNMTKLQVCFNK